MPGFKGRVVGFVKATPIVDQPTNGDVSLTYALHIFPSYIEGETSQVKIEAVEAYKNHKGEERPKGNTFCKDITSDWDFYNKEKNRPFIFINKNLK